MQSSCHAIFLQIFNSWFRRWSRHWKILRQPAVGDGLVAILYIFPSIGFLIIPTNSYFSEGGSTTNQWCLQCPRIRTRTWSLCMSFQRSLRWAQSWWWGVYWFLPIRTSEHMEVSIVMGVLYTGKILLEWMIWGYLHIWKSPISLIGQPRFADEIRIT